MSESGEMPWRSAAGPVGHCYICPLSKCKALLVVQISTLGSHSWGRGIMPLLPCHCVLLLSSLPSGTRAHPHSPWVVPGTFEAARASLPRHTAVLHAGCGAVLLVALCTLRVQAHPCLKHGRGIGWGTGLPFRDHLCSPHPSSHPEGTLLSLLTVLPNLLS